MLTKGNRGEIDFMYIYIKKKKLSQNITSYAA